MAKGVTGIITQCQPIPAIMGESFRCLVGDCLFQVMADDVGQKFLDHGLVGLHVSVSTYSKPVFTIPKPKFSSMNFSQALEAVKKGHSIYRNHWRSLTYVRLVNLYGDKHYEIAEKGEIDGTLMPYLAMKTTENTFVPWCIQHDDLLANDWSVM